MKGQGFPVVALALGAALLAIVVLGGRTDADGGTALPLLLLLGASEFGLIVTAIGAFLGIRRIPAGGLTARSAGPAVGCALLAVAFLVRGLQLWPL